MIKRPAKMTEGKAGIFSIISDECPLGEAARILETPPPECVAGIITNIQGPVILKTCKYCPKDTGLVSENKKLFVNCGWEKK